VGPAVIDKSIREIAEIEDAQAALRDSIEATKELAERAEDLLQKHKARVEKENSGDAA
jgi:hypothetical protein